MLSIVSLLNDNDRKALGDNAMIKTSASIRDAAKIGLQSLYANADEIFEKYKDFDLIKEMKSRKEANLLWVRARAIDADVVNTNGDYFSEEELLKENDYQGTKKPAYKTFEGVPIYTNHKNDDIEQAKGMVVYAEWDEEEKCVYCVFFIDEDAYPDIARGIRLGYLTDVSMGASVENGICSICGNKAFIIDDYCDCLKDYKGRQHPSGKKAFEYNYGIKFIELSCVGDGAFESCTIEEIYDQSEILEQAKEIIKTANAINKSISVTAAINSDPHERREVEKALRQLYSLNNDFIRLAQAAGTLVGGQLLGGGVQQNATVSKILQALGVNSANSLNVLDLVNLALNFLEVAVLNLFARKDNIDLQHVAKITKAMGDLQNNLQDMIDDGVETGQNPQQPMVPAQQPQQPAQPQPQNPQQPNAQQAAFEPSVGKMISPMSDEFVMPLGGGVAASSNVRLVWASTNEEIKKTPELNKFGKFALAVDNLRKACGIPERIKEDVNLFPQKELKASNKDKYMVDLFKKLAQDAKKNNTVALGIDIKLEDKNGSRVVLSSDKGIKGFYKGQLLNWSPVLSESQISQMETGDGIRVASEILQDFSSFVKKAEQEKTIDTLVVYNQSLEADKEYEHPDARTEITKSHGTDALTTLQNKLEERREDKIVDEVWEDHLEADRDNELVHVTAELAEDAKKSIGHLPLEEMLHPDMEYSKIHGREVMTSVLSSIARTCLATKSKPKDVLSFLTKASDNKDFGKIIKLARLGTPARAYGYLMNRYSQALNSPEDSMDSLGGDSTGENPDLSTPPGDDLGGDSLGISAIKNIADNAPKEMTEGDITKALQVLKDSLEQAADKISEMLPEEEKDKGDDMKDALGDSDDVSPDDVNGAVTGMSLSGEDTGANPSDIVDSVNSMPSDQMASGINSARQPHNALARANNRKITTASKKDLNSNLIGWLADVANYNNLSTNKIVEAAKMFCEKKNASSYLAKAMKVADVKVTDETTHTTTIWATLEDVGVDVKDAAFNQKFRDYAVDLLSNSGYEVDPGTFALTEVNVDEGGMVCGKVTTRATKTFSPDSISATFEGNEYHDEDRDAVNQPGSDMYGTNMPDKDMPGTIMGEGQLVLSESAKSARRLARIKNVIKVAQGLGLPGAPPQGAPIASPATPDQSQGGMAGGNADLGLPGGDQGLSSLTGGTSDTPINDSPEPGTAAPWGTVCPQCGSKDLDITNGEGKCNSCNTQLKFKFTVEATPPSQGGETPPPTPEAGGTPDMGAEPAAMPGAPTGAPAGAPPSGMPGQAMASAPRVMVRVAYQTSADVYAASLQDNFNKFTATKLPVGMCCPKCGSRTASKESNKTYCYDCGTLSVSEIKRVQDKPGILEAVIKWM